MGTSGPLGGRHSRLCAVVLATTLACIPGFALAQDAGAPSDIPRPPAAIPTPPAVQSLAPTGSIGPPTALMPAIPAPPPAAAPVPPPAPPQLQSLPATPPGQVAL